MNSGAANYTQSTTTNKVRCSPTLTHLVCNAVTTLFKVKWGNGEGQRQEMEEREKRKERTTGGENGGQSNLPLMCAWGLNLISLWVKSWMNVCWIWSCQGPQNLRSMGKCQGLPSWSECDCWWCVQEMSSIPTPLGHLQARGDFPINCSYWD